MNLPFLIAKTHLVSNKKQTMVAMLGVTFGIGMFIALVSLMTGLNKFTEEITMTSSPDIRIYHDITQPRTPILDKVFPNSLNKIWNTKPKNESPKIRNAFQIIASLKKDSMVYGVSPLINSQVFYNYGPIKLNGQITGVNILDENKLFDLSSKMKVGNIKNLLAAKDGIIMGSGLAKKLNVGVNNRVLVTTPDGVIFTLKIVGVFQLGLGAIDNIKSYANIETVQKLLEQDASYITDINIKLLDNAFAKEKSKIFQETYHYTAEDWETANATFLTGTMIRNIITSAVSFTLLIVAGFGIYNILNMTISNKMKDIAILKATGFTGKDVRNIFMIQSLTIGVLGSILGLIIGFILSTLISLAPFNGGDVINLDHFPVNFSPTYYVVGIVFGILTTALAGFMPSKKAGKIDPIEIIRGQ
jgi:lipoprotein-releasing system permease protein